MGGVRHLTLELVADVAHNGQGPGRVVLKGIL